MSIDYIIKVFKDNALAFVLGAGVGAAVAWTIQEQIGKQKAEA